MAERFLVIESLLIADGYICTSTSHPKMNHYFTLYSKNGNILFGLGILDGKLAIVRFSHLDGEGPTAYLSISADISRIILAIELLAKGAVRANPEANVTAA